MKQHAALFALALLLTAGSSAHATSRVQYASLDVHNALMAPDEAKFASVDVQRILDLSYAGKEAKAKLESAALKAEMEKNSREKELNKLNAELEQQGPLLSETERSAKQKSYEGKLMEYRQFVTRSTDELRAENAELTRSLLGGEGDVVDVVDLFEDLPQDYPLLYVGLAQVHCTSDASQRHCVNTSHLDTSHV